MSCVSITCCAQVCEVSFHFERCSFGIEREVADTAHGDTCDTTQDVCVWGCVNVLVFVYWCRRVSCCVVLRERCAERSNMFVCRGRTFLGVDIEVAQRRCRYGEELEVVHV